MFTALYSFQQFNIYALNENVVKQYSQDICLSLDQIPLVEKHTQEHLLMMQKGERKLHKKWEHSLIALCDDEYAGIIVGYERESENNAQYPRNSIYLNDLAVNAKYQNKGLGRFLIDCWLKHNKSVGFLILRGALTFSVQTNAADWNEHVQKLYTSFGFHKIAEKIYENRVDNVYMLE